MVITHIIGNGFDINQGLKTSYKDFYRDYYLKQDSSESVIDELKSAISGDIENWSDLELAIGKYTAHIASVEDLDIVMSDLQENLANYIAEIDSKQHTVEKKSADEIRQDLISPYRHLKAREIESFNTLKMNFGNVSDVNVLSFNYTSTLEKILQLDNGRMLGADGNSKPILRKMTYIHNSIENKGSIVLGVDNPLQIENQAFQKDNIAQLYLVKPKIIENAGALNEREALRKLEQANVISIFGVSLGETDTTWWKAIGHAVNSSPSRCLIYYNFDLKNQSNINRQLASEARLKTRIVELLEIRDSTRVFVKQHDGSLMFKKAFL